MEGSSEPLLDAKSKVTNQNFYRQFKEIAAVIETV